MCSVLILSITNYSWNSTPFAGQIKSILQIKYTPQYHDHPVATSDLVYYINFCFIWSNFCIASSMWKEDKLSSREEELEKWGIEESNYKKDF